MTNNLGSSILRGLFGGGQLRDYTHAAKTFRPNSNANAGKYKYLFHVVFNINTQVGLQVDKRSLSYLVKKADLPKFNMETREMNQYNRKQLNQVHIKYQPVSIVFHDDNANSIRELWRTYYNYYYSDGRYSPGTYNFNDKYSDRVASTWGLDSGSTVNFFTSIDIYSMWAGQAYATTLMNPMITSFNHDTHEYSDGNSLMEHTMTITYTGVKYQTGYYSGVPGFATGADYDLTPSDLSGGYSGYQYDSSGNLFNPPESFTDPWQAGQSTYDNSIAQRYSTDNFGNGQVSQMSPYDTQAILNQQTWSPGLGYGFPTAANPNQFSGNPQGVVDIGSQVQAISDNTILSDNKQYFNTFESGTWQSTLEQKGYNPADIVAAEAAVAANPAVLDNADAQKYAEQYIQLADSTRAVADPQYSSPITNYPVSFTNSQSLQPVYNGQAWQQSLLAKGYSTSEISQAEIVLGNVNLSPSVDVASYAEKIIQGYNQ